jgi:hypothetical protein
MYKKISNGLNEIKISIRFTSYSNNSMLKKVNVTTKPAVNNKSKSMHIIISKKYVKENKNRNKVNSIHKLDTIAILLNLIFSFYGANCWVNLPIKYVVFSALALTLAYLILNRKNLN